MGAPNSMRLGLSLLLSLGAPNSVRLGYPNFLSDQKTIIPFMKPTLETPFYMRLGVRSSASHEVGNAKWINSIIIIINLSISFDIHEKAKTFFLL